jgi:hypothetical protein
MSHRYFKTAQTVALWASRSACIFILVSAAFLVADILAEDSVYSWRLFGFIGALMVATGAAVLWAVASLVTRRYKA